MYNLGEMKRLLAYLFIVLGLGLAVNNFAFAQCLGNCSNGYGMFTWPGGAKYVGEWKKGEAHGQGTFTFPSGTKYVGEWKDSKMHGQGTLTWLNGRIDNGIWKNGDLVERNNIKTQIAKKEPTQKQQVAKKESNNLTNTIRTELVVDRFYQSLYGCWSIPLGLHYSSKDVYVKIKLQFMIIKSVHPSHPADCLISIGLIVGLGAKSGHIVA